MVTTLISHAMLTLLLSPYLPVASLVLLYIAGGVAAVGRYWIARTVKRQARVFSALEVRTLIALTAISGLTWSAPLFLIQPGTDYITREIILFFVAGMTAGACLAYASHPTFVAAFAVSALGPVLVNFVWLRDFAHIGMTVAVLLFFGMTISMSKRIGRAVQSFYDNEWEAERRREQVERQKRDLDAQIAARKRSEAELEATLERYRGYNDILECIFNKSADAKGASPELIQETTKAISHALKVERVSLWLYSDDRAEIICQDLYKRSQNRHSVEGKSKVADHKAYLGAIETARMIVAPDIKEDLRAQSFVDDFVKRENIISALDLPLRGASGVRGFISCHSVGERRDWTVDEIGFVESVAQFVGMSLLADDAAQLSDALRLALRDAEKANETQSAFLAIMSHEIRTPMNGVMGAGQILSRMDLPDDAQQFVQIMNDCGASLMRQLNDLLDMAKFDAGEIRLEEEPFQLRAEIQKATSAHALTAREKGVGFEVSADENLADRRIGDPHRLGQILHNLASNAVKFTNQGKVELRVYSGTDDVSNEERVLIVIEDSGVGIPQDKLEAIFDPFTQADASISRKYGGTGLGLPIAKTLCEAMGGTIHVMSELGVGTVFRLALPLALAEQPQREARSGDESARRPNSGAAVLVAEDNAVNRAVLAEYLKTLQLAPTFAVDGREAVRLFKTGKFDLVLMDIRMPVLDGEAALTRIRDYEAEYGRPATPVVAVTADAMDDQIRSHLASGFDAHLAKPINLARLTETVCRFLDNENAFQGSEVA